MYWHTRYPAPPTLVGLYIYVYVLLRLSDSHGPLHVKIQHSVIEEVNCECQNGLNIAHFEVGCTHFDGVVFINKGGVFIWGEY